MSIYDNIYRELFSLSQEIVSTKVLDRNKSNDRLNVMLSSNKDEIIYIMADSKYNANLTWTNLYSSSVESILQHSNKLDPSIKGYQTSANKNPTYASVLHKIVEISFECKVSKNITSNALYQGILTLIQSRNTRDHFGTTILRIIEETLFSENLCILTDLKLNDFIELLSSIFTMAKKSKQNLIHALKCAIKGIDFGTKCFECTHSLFEILDYVQIYNEKAENDEKLLDLVIKLDISILEQLSVDGHQNILDFYKKNIGLFCNFYNPRLRPETKEHLFELFSLLFIMFFPNFNEDYAFQINETKSINWTKINRKLFYIVETEIKEKYSSLSSYEERNESFEDFATNTIRLIYLMKTYEISTSVNERCSNPKISKTSTNLEDILKLVNVNNRIINSPVWFTILVKFLKYEKSLIDITSLQLLLKILIEFSNQNFDIVTDIKYVSELAELLLEKETEFIKTDLFNEQWQNFIVYIISELNYEADPAIVHEKHILFNILIKFGKINSVMSTNLIKTLIETKKINNINSLRIIREMVINNGINVVTQNGLDNFFTQLYNSNSNFQTDNINDKFLKYLGEITVILLLNNFEKFDKNVLIETDIKSSKLNKSKNFEIENNIQYKYMRKFIAIECRNKEKIKTTRNNINYLNEKHMEILLKNSDFQLNEKSSLSENLCKIEILLMLIENFSKFNIIGSNTEVCILKKKFGLLIHIICNQIKTHTEQHIFGLECLAISSLVNKLNRIILQLKDIQLFEYSDQYVMEFTEFLNRILNCLLSKSKEWELEIVDDIQLNVYKIFSIMSDFNGFKMKTFKLIKDSPLLEKNNMKKNNNKNVNLFFDILKYLVKENEFQNQEIPDWILEYLEIICKLYHNNLFISTKVIESLSSIAKSFKQFPDNISVIFVILSSYMKICYKSKFNAKFTHKVISLFKEIAQIYPDLIINDEDIRLLYTSTIGKFFLSSSLLVKFSVVECVSFLLDPTWLWENSTIPDNYIAFSKELYKSIDWLTLLKDNQEDDAMNADIRFNTISAIAQLFMSLFGFSYINNHLGFLEMADFCKNYQLNYNYFKDRHISQFENYFQCEYDSLTVGSCEKMISFWIKQKFNLNEIPWYLCDREENSFYVKNSETFAFTALKNSKKYLLELEQKIGIKSEILLKNCLERCYAFIIPYNLKLITKNSDYILMNTDYIPEVNNIINNLKHYNIDIDSFENSLKLHEVIYYLLNDFSDNNKFCQLTNFKHHFCNIEDFNFEILQNVLSNLPNKSIKFSIFAKNNQHCIIKLNEKLKRTVFFTIFIKDKLLWICRYMTIIDLLNITEIEDDFDWFFAKDVIYFITSLLKNFYNEFLIFRAVISFAENFLKILVKWSSQLEDAFFEIINQVIEIAEKNSEVKEKLKYCLVFLENLFCWIIESKNELLSRLEPLMEKEIFKGTSIEMHSNKIPSVTKVPIIDDLKYFISSKIKTSYAISKLSLNISKKKQEFINLLQNIADQDYVQNVINCLVEIIRNGSNKEAKSAVDCLGSIGPVFISKYAFIKENKLNSSEDEDSLEMKIVQAIENIIFIYDFQSYSFILSVATILANSDTFKLISNNQRFLKPFAKMEISLHSLHIEYKFKVNIDLKKILCDNSNESIFEKFLKKLTSKIFQCLKLEEFEKLSSVCHEFNEMIILPLFRKLLETNEEFKIKLLNMLEHFFAEANNAIENSNYIKPNYLNKRTIKLMLDLTELYRLKNNFEIELNLINVANVAAFQQAYFLAIFYLELWALNERKLSEFNILNIDLIQNKQIQKLAFLILNEIECKDALNGFIDPIESQIEYFNNNNDWMEILIEIDSTNSLNNSKFFLDILKRNGLLNLSRIIQNSSEKLLNEIDYEIYWRLGNWEVVESDTIVIDSSNNYFENLGNQFEKIHYEALKAIKDKDETNTIRSIEKAKETIIKIMKESSIESVQNFYKHLTNLMLLRQIEEFSTIQFSATGRSLLSPDLILNNWELEYNMRYGNFTNKEKLMAQKITLFELAGTRAERKISEYYNGSNAVAKFLLNVVEDCKNFQISENSYLAKRYLKKLKSLTNVNEEINCRTDLIHAEICIKDGNKSMAFAILQNKIKEPSTSNNILYQIDTYRLLGMYLADANDEGFNEIHKRYFNKANILLEKLEEMIKKGNLNTINKENFNIIRKNLFKNIAEYADREYEQIDSHMKSEDFLKSIEIMQKHRNDAKIIKQTIDRDAPDYRDKAECCSVLERNAILDANNIVHFQESRKKYLQLALKNYIAHCKMDEAIQSSTIYRIIALWLSNKNDDEINQIMDECEIPSYKFVNVLSQLTAQLNSSELKFIEILKKIIVKCVLDYPYHTMKNIISIFTADEDQQYFNKNAQKPQNKDNLRQIRIKEILSTIKKDKTCLEIFNQMHLMYKNLIECAYWNMQEPIAKNKIIKDYSLSEKLKKMKYLDKVHCPTINLPIKPIVNENINQEIISIINWDYKYEPVGGITAPKKIYCNCSDGIKRPQLLKGNDDLRQDAVMQQVLTFVNSLLAQSKVNSDLSIRTYEVVPLSKRSGLLEWCVNTTTLSNYLCGKTRIGGAHAKYRPKDKSSLECRTLLMKYKSSPPETRVNIFKDICQKIQPVLHYFFFERFTNPGVWFEKRLAYMNSVATTSMIGFILGLGDRHCQNILLDEKTAEVIHIDFGIAFEKGKVMPTPETVPFRLTREMVSPMGICEVNGIFRKSCEQTLSILRENHQVLLTILEVLLYDPLYSWSLNDRILRRMNHEKKESVSINLNNDENLKNTSAHRALLRIQAKLEGRSDKQIGSISVNTHVEKLIAEARNVNNLGLLFPGWDPYL